MGVQGTMRENYYGADTEADMPRKSNLEAPRVTLNNKRMTNIQLPGGEVVQGIRGNKDLGYDGAPEAAYEPPLPLKPLRYNPGLKCDAALETMRPERNPKHKSISAREETDASRARSSGAARVPAAHDAAPVHAYDVPSPAHDHGQ